MKKIIVLISLAATLSGCYTGKPYTLGKHETIDTIRAEFHRDDKATRAEFQRKKKLIQAAWKKEIAEAEAVLKSGFISPRAFQLREHNINKKFGAQLDALEDRTENRLYAIDQRFDGKYAAWLDRK